MKNYLITLGLAVVACLATFAAFYGLHDDAAMRQAAREGDPMAWMRAEFQIDDAQFAAIEKLHDEYGMVCVEHCAMITNARQQAAPAGELARLERLCVDAMTGHFRRVAALMSPAEGDRYLATVLPRIAGYEHAGAPSLQVTP
jgi:hypothetical protein